MEENMQITLLKGQQLEEIHLSFKHVGDYIIKGYNYEPLLKIFQKEHMWYAQTLADVFLSVGLHKYRYCLLEPQTIYSLDTLQGDKIFFIFENHKRDTFIFQKLQMKVKSICIGRSHHCDLCYEHPFVSYKHAKLSFTYGNWYIEDLNSTNGTFVNQRKIKKSLLAFGDIIDIMGLKIIIAKQCFICNRIQEIYLSPTIAKYIPYDFLNPTYIRDKSFYSPSLRMSAFPCCQEYTIEAPPLQVSEQRKLSLLYILGPSLTMGFPSFYNLFLQMMEVQKGNKSIKDIFSSFVVSISMLISILIWPLFMKLQENRQRKKVQQERIHVYLEYLSQIVTRIHKEKEAIHIYCSQTFPMLEECLMRIKKKQLLWSMDPLDPSFLTIRLGIGNIPLDLNVHFPSYSVVYKKDMILDKLENIKKDIYIQENTPVLISLQTFWKVGIVGDYARVYTYSLVLQLCALYKYTDVNVLLIIDEQDEEAYQLRWLPHITNYVSMKRLLIKGKKHEWKMNSHLMEIFHKQKEKDSFSSYFIIVDFTKDRTLEIVNIILSNKKYRGFSYIQVASSYDELDHRLSTVVQLDKEKGILRKQEGMSPIYFQIDYVNKHEVYEGCRQLANIQLKRHHKESSQSLSFLTLFGVEKVEQLDIVQRWASFSNMSLQTPLGTDINGEIIYLDVHEKAHGPHGLFAGMTGSGKSECLITYLLSLCVNYHPDFIGIILIDYKGGGTSLSLADLPHMQGVITNLDHGEAERYLKSIECEIIRRQKIFHHIVNSLKLREIDIDQYHTLYQQKVVKEAIPHLLIVCDEFAELKRQQPEFMEQLISASRIGRSLGIHLLLATQKPTGVVDEQIWSNTRFRICLKVADRCDSMDMIKREDAAYLQKAGSFYFQVGHNEVFLKGQTAWAKAPYRSVQEKNKKLYAIDAKGDIIYEYKFSSYKEEAQLSYIIDYILKFAKKEKIQKKEIWKPCLPKHLKREDIFYTIEEHEQFRVVIGKVDDVERQCYQKLSISVLEEKQIVLLGNDSESKTIFLIALLYEYIKHYSKEELQIYIVDFENASLQIFQQAPQIIDILFTYDVYKIKTMMDYLKKIIMERKGCDTQPLLLVILHNYALLKEYDNTFDFELMHLIREGGKVGISIVITANTSSELSYRVMQYIQHYYVFQLQDPSEYCSIFQTSRVKKIPAYPGRGLYKKDSIYEFQVHHIDKEDIGRSEKV